MSQWNNSYAYNNQYQQDSNGWNGDPANQYANHAYYSRPDANGQYVSFNEFLTQMQNSNVAAPSNTGSFNNAQYDNYTTGQYNYQNMPSSSQTQLDYNYGSSGGSNEASAYPQKKFNATSSNQNTYSASAPFKSNLTATAVEFVPKSSFPNPSGSQNIPESSNSYKDVSDGANETQSKHGSSSDRNWRHRPQKSSDTNDQKPVSNMQQDSQKSYGRNRDNLQRNYENNGRNNKKEDYSTESNTTSNETNGRSQEYQSHEASNVNREPRQKNYDSSRNQETRRNQDSRQSERNQEPRNRNNNDRGQDTKRNNDSNSRNRDSANFDSNDRGQESRDDSNRYEPRNERRNQSKGNPRTKANKDDRTFYNSGVSKDSQDSRGRGEDSGRTDDKSRDSNGWSENQQRDNHRREARDSYNSRDNYGREGRSDGSGRVQRNWAGTQRTRGDRRENDEQFANTYSQKEERDRTDWSYDRGERDKGYDRDRYDKSERERGYDRDRYDKPDRERGYDRDRYDRQDKQKNSPARFKSKQQTDCANKEMTQRERLTEQLDKGTLECLVCCDRVRQTDPVWSCSNCFHVLHLRCIRKWAMSSVIEGKWRCPACQNTSKAIPTEYRCMCGAIRSPDYQRGSVAHTCGKSCKRERTCVHPCTLLCHPGPCPPCQATVNKQCGCGAETRSILCSSKLAQVCGRTCNRTLSCRVHTCGKECHEGGCDDCGNTVTQVCYCPAATERTVACTAETGSVSQWQCGRGCGRILTCGAHVCRAECHAPPCPSCALLPSAIASCPCGKMQLDKKARKACTDPIPLCGNICAKPLSCGPSGDKHFCKLVCHEGPCPVCPDSTLVQCRCGHSSRDVPCADLPEMLNNVLCQKKCNKKLSCGRHRCRATCCDAASHRCSVTCARSLTCGLHRCEEFCHTGHCPPCPRLSFDELRCECGASVLLPPVACGARAPPCDGPCPRARPCSHPPHHSCHSGECPPCVVLTTKKCYGGHEERKTIPCSLEEFSCGLPCGKPLPCGKHNCIKTCHKGPCDTGKCTQPCTEKRPACGHPCSAQCHAPRACPAAAPCRAAVRAACPCGRRAAPRPCHENSKDLARIMSALAVTKMQEGGAIEITEQRPANMLKTLECDDECRVEARTRQMALALQIRNPDVSAKLAPRYSDHVRATAQREPAFAQQIHDKLTDLVQLAKKSKQKTRAHSFPSMNWQKRQFIHELCEHFGCESVAYDAEPNRNVVATADKEKSWLPAMSVLEVLGREAGKRRVPGPVLRAPAQPAAAPDAAKSGSGWATLTSSKTNAWAARSQTQAKPEPKPEPKIDYFDNPPDN